jgi:hypothetical protein
MQMNMGRMLLASAWRINLTKPCCLVIRPSEMMISNCTLSSCCDECARADSKMLVEVSSSWVKLVDF